MISILSQIQTSKVQPPQLYIVPSLGLLSCTLPIKNVLYIEHAYARVRVPRKRRTPKYGPRLFQFLYTVSAQYDENWGFMDECPWALTQDTTVYAICT